MALRARDRGGPPIALQVLIYPVTDADFDRPSYVDPDNQLLLTDATRWSGSGTTTCPTPPAAPSLTPRRCKATTLAGLPPAVVLTAEHDVLRDEGEAYADAPRRRPASPSTSAATTARRTASSRCCMLPGSERGFQHVVKAVRACTVAHEQGRRGGRLNAQGARPTWTPAHRDRDPITDDVDAVVIGAGFAGLYMNHRLRDQMGLRRAGVRGRRRRRRHLVLEPLPRRPLRLRVVHLLLLLRQGPDAGVGVEREVPGAAGDPALPQPRRRPLRPPPQRRRSRPASTVGPLGRGDAAAGRSRPTAATGSAPSSSSPPSAACRPARSRRSRASSRSRATGTTPVRGPTTGVDFTGKRVGVIGTGSSGVQSIPRDRRAGRPPHGVPAHAAVHRPGPPRHRRQGVPRRGQDPLRRHLRAVPAGRPAASRTR